MFKRLPILVLAVTLAGCQTSSRKTGQDEYDPANLSYYRDKRTKLCFAAISYDRMDTSARTASGLTHANVPCSPEVLALVPAQYKDN